MAKQPTSNRYNSAFYTGSARWYIRNNISIDDERTKICKNCGRPFMAHVATKYMDESFCHEGRSYPKFEIDEDKTEEFKAIINFLSRSKIEKKAGENGN